MREVVRHLWCVHYPACLSVHVRCGKGRFDCSRCARYRPIHLEAEGDVTILGGIIGDHTTVVKAGQDLRAKFVESARLRAGRDIIVQEIIMHSECNAGRAVICFSAPMWADLKVLRTVLFDRVYRHPRVLRVMTAAEGIVRDLFGAYAGSNHRTALPEAWQEISERLPPRDRISLGLLGFPLAPRNLQRYSPGL